MSLTHKPTGGMRDEARRGLEWREEFGRGGTDVGVARARDIANGRNLSSETVKRMVSFFARHESSTKGGKGFSPGEDGYPSAGRIAWALWGGDPGKTWSEKEARRIDREREKTQMSRMQKQVARPGVWEDMHGQELAFTPELAAALVDETERLMATGFKVRGYSSHMTDDSKDVMGTWDGFAVDSDGGIVGVFDPIDEDSGNRAQALDTSMVIEEGVTVDGQAFGAVITRCDIVGQGAIVGTGEFKALSRRRFQLSRMQAEDSMKDKAEMSDEAKAEMGEKAEMAESSGPAPGMLETAFALAMGCEPGEVAGKVEAMGAEGLAEKLKAAFMEAEPEAEEPKAEMMEGDDESAAEKLAEAMAEIEALESEMLAAALSEAPEDERAEMKAHYSLTRQKTGSVSFSIKSLRRELGLRKKLMLSSVNAAAAVNSVKLDRPGKSDGKASPLAAAAKRLGWKTGKTQAKN